MRSKTGTLRLARRPAIRVICLAACIALLGGCNQPAPASGSVQAPDFSTSWLVEVTPQEPFEKPGPIHLAWSGQAFAVRSVGEPRMPGEAVRQGGEVHVRNADLGWTTYTMGEVEAGFVSPWILLFDLKARLQETPMLATATGWEARGVLERPRIPYVMAGDGGEIRMDAPAAGESPYTFMPAPQAYQVPQPTPALPAAAAREGDLESQVAHRALLRLVERYTRTHAGQVPRELTPETLRAEVLLSQEPWPANAFAQEGLRHAHAPGHFEWRTCSETDAHYNGLGWGATVLTKSFGSGCAP